MSGIVGFTGNNPKKINAFNKSIRHRGPSHHEIFTNDHISLGHTRLTLLDQTNAGNQPMFYIPDKGAGSLKHHPEIIKDAQIACVFDGQIYNYIEVRSLLHGKGYTFTSETDTEVLLAAYCEWGTHFLERLNGMWAFCIYDMKNEVLFLSRDRLGIKPLYYHHNNEVLTFASELKPFYLSDIPIEIDPKALNHYYLLSTSHNEQTVLKGVKKLPAGTNMIYDLKKKNIGIIEKYRQNQFSEDVISETFASEKIIKLLHDSVKKRIQTNGETGVVLNGAIESSALVMLMKEQNQQLKSFSIKFDNEENDATRYNKLISETFKTEHFEVECTADDIKKTIETLPLYYDEPFGNTAMISDYLIAKVAANHVKVVLSTTGYGEIFAENNRYTDYFQLLSLRKVPGIIRKLTSSNYKKFKKVNPGKLKQLLVTKNNKLLYIKLISSVFGNDADAHYNMEEIDELYTFFGKQNGLNAVLNFDQNHYLPNNLLINDDRAYMAKGVESRHPYLDHRLVDYVNALDRNLKMTDESTNNILKESMKELIPEELLNGPSKKTNIPLNRYFRNELKEYSYNLIMENLKYFPEFSEDYIKQIWELHQSETCDYSSQLWNLIMLIKWHERYMR